jgi:hypothetical protein
VSDYTPLITLLRDHSVAELATAIETHGCMYWDRYGRLVEATDTQPALGALAAYYEAQVRAEMGDVDAMQWMNHVDSDPKPGAPLWDYGWTDLPPFKTVVQPWRPKAKRLDAVAKVLAQEYEVMDRPPDAKAMWIRLVVDYGNKDDTITIADKVIDWDNFRQRFRRQFLSFDGR